MLKKVKTEM